MTKIATSLRAGRRPAVGAALVLLPLAGVLWMAAPSCNGDTDSLVMVSVAGPTTLPPIYQLHAILSNADTPDDKMFPQAPATQPIGLGTAFSFTVPHARAGDIDIAIDALGLQGDVVANGAARATIQVGGRVDVSITLAAGASLCGNRNVDQGEDCDDGDRISDATCDFRCQRPVTGPNGRGGGTGGSTIGVEGDAGATGGAGGGCATELLANSAFDSGDTAWTAGSTVNQRLIYMGGDPALGGFAPSSPSYLAMLGRNLGTGEESLSQAIRVPAAARMLTLKGVYHTAVTTCTTCNNGFVELVQAGVPVPLVSWTGRDGNNGWQNFTATLDAVALRDVALTFRLRVAVTGGSISPFFFDSLSLKVDRCAP